MIEKEGQDMKRRTAADLTKNYAPEPSSIQSPGESFPPVLKKARRLQPEESKDKFSAKNLITMTSRRENSIEKVIGEPITETSILARVKDHLKAGVPYTFAATKTGNKFSMRPDTNEIIKQFIENKLPSAKKEEIYFCSFVEQNKSPVLLGTPDNINKTGADETLRSYLLEPQQLDDDHQLRSRVLFRGLFDASGISSSFPGFIEKLRNFGEPYDVSFAEAELVIDTALLKTTFFLETLLNLGFPANSFSHETGTWAVTVAKRHKRDESLKLLAEHGADMNVREKTPI